MNERMKQKQGPCPLGETLPLNQDDVPEQITDKELAEQSALHAEFVAAVANDPEFVDRTRRAHEDAKARRFVTMDGVEEVMRKLAEKSAPE